MTQTTSTYAPASEKQIKFLDDLVNNREVPREMVSAYLAEKETLDIKKASSLIGLFLGYPKMVVQPTLPSPAFAELVKKAEPNLYGELIGALQGVPKSKYAIPVSELMTDLLKEKVYGDLVFVEVKEYMKKTYIKKLYGSVGAFTRVRPAVEDALVFTRIIKADPYKYTKLFAE